MTTHAQQLQCVHLILPALHEHDKTKPVRSITVAYGLRYLDQKNLQGKPKSATVRLTLNTFISTECSQCPLDLTSCSSLLCINIAIRRRITPRIQTRIIICSSLYTQTIAFIQYNTMAAINNK